MHLPSIPPGGRDADCGGQEGGPSRGSPVMGLAVARSTQGLKVLPVQPARIRGPQPVAVVGDLGAPLTAADTHRMHVKQLPGCALPRRRAVTLSAVAGVLRGGAALLAGRAAVPRTDPEKRCAVKARSPRHRSSPGLGDTHHPRVGVPEPRLPAHKKNVGLGLLSRRHSAFHAADALFRVSQPRYSQKHAQTPRARIFFQEGSGGRRGWSAS